MRSGPALIAIRRPWSRDQTASDTFAPRVYDPRAKSSLLAIAEYGKPKEGERLLKYATWRTKNEEDARDLIADAMVRVCDPQDKPWDPTKGSFFRHMRLVMDDDVVEQHRRGFKKFEIVDSDHEAFDRAVQPTPGPDMALQAKRRLGWLRGMMLTLIGRLKDNDELALSIYELACDNRHEEPEEFAQALGVPVAEIYEAMRRLRYHGAIVREEWEKREKLRMAQLRLRDEAERATKKEQP
jgi:DNA-directed RNA polymerase specialized sigma24 family protein